jgi:hypothetical protein
MADALAEVLALAEKALTAENVGRFARAAELRGRALAVALAAGAPVGGADSLIATDLRLQRASALVGQARAPGVPVEDAAALCITAWALMCDMMRTLRARIAAHTLLPGGVSPTEAQFYTRINRMEMTAAMPEIAADPELMAEAAEAVACLGGYATAMSAALVLQRLMLQQLPLPPLTAAEAADTQEFVLSAFALVPCIEFGVVKHQLHCESHMLHLMTQLLAPENRGIFEPDFEVALREAWTRPDVQAALRAHGAMGKRGSLTNYSVADAITGERERAARDALAGAGLRSCALGAACGKREATRQQFKLCSACKTVAYCCREHQAAHWPVHKAACKVARTAAAGRD